MIRSKRTVGLVLTSAALALSLSPAQSVAAGYDLDRLDHAASAHGWATSWADDGSLLLWHRSSADEISAFAIDRQPPARDPLADLSQRLAETGWEVSRDHDGNLLFWPKTTEPSHGAAPVVASSQRSAPKIAEPPAPDPGASLAQGLAHGLAHAGWQVSRDPDGSVRFWRGATPTTAAVPPVLAATQRLQWQSQQDITAPAGSDPLVGFADRLAETGWQVSRAHDGSLLFWSDAKQADAAGPTLASPQPLITQASASSTGPDPWAEFADRLGAAGWLVSRGDDDSLLLWPRAEQANQPPRSSRPVNA